MLISKAGRRSREVEDKNNVARGGCLVDVDDTQHRGDELHSS